MVNKPNEYKSYQAAESEPLTEQALIDGLRRGDEAVFIDLVGQFHALMVRVALMYVDDHGLAEEIVQDTWIGVLEGIHRFEGRSSLKTWIFKILTNRAIQRHQREARSITFSDLGHFEGSEDGPAVEPERFLPPDHPQWPDGWSVPPRAWDRTLEHHLLSQEISRTIQQAVERLSQQQQIIFVLHDIERWSSQEICSALDLSEINQRVLLHRARSKIRRALESYFENEDTN